MKLARRPASIRWKFWTMSTKLNRGWTPRNSATSPSSSSRSTSRVFLPVSWWSEIARLVTTVVEPDPPLALAKA